MYFGDITRIIKMINASYILTPVSCYHGWVVDKLVNGKLLYQLTVVMITDCRNSGLFKYL